jgi:hypothetical protein
MPLAQAVWKSVPQQHQKMTRQVHDRFWPVKILNALNQHWQKRNAQRKNCPADGSLKSYSSLEYINGCCWLSEVFGLRRNNEIK